MSKQQLEQAIHKAVVLHLKIRGVDGLVFLHPANGGYRHAREAAQLKAMGVVPGAPDLLLWHNGRSYALELKTPNGRETETQVNMRLQLQRAGVETGIAYGMDAAIVVLENWKLLKGSV